jgi:CBS domain-containing protein
MRTHCYEIMKKRVEVVPVSTGANEAARRMHELAVGFFPVCTESGTLAGVVTDRDIALRVCGAGLPGNTPVQDIMTRQVVRCSPEDNVTKAEALMARYGVHHVVVCDEANHVVGLLSLSDLAQHEAPLRLARLVRDVAAHAFRVESSRSVPIP